MKISRNYLFVPVLLASFSYLFYSAYNDVRERTLDEFNSHQFVLARQASRGIESFFIYYQRELQFLSRLQYVSELNDQGRELLAEFYNNHSDQIEAISVLDSKGVLIYTFPLNLSATGQDISDQAHVKSVIETHKPTVSDVFTSVQGYKTIAYHIPIIKDNEYMGSIAILIPLDKLGARFVENIKTGETGYGWMISEDGIELFNPLDNHSGQSVYSTYKSFPFVLELINRSLLETEGTSICYFSQTENKNKEPVKTLAAFYRIPLDNTFWTIIIFTPEKEVYSTLKSFQNRLFIIFFLFITMMITYYFLSFKASSILKEEKKRKALEVILRDSERRFRIMFELSPAGIILINEKGTIIEVNSSFCETIGYSREEIILKNISLFTSPDKEGDVERNMTRVLSGETLKHEVTNFRKDGSKCVIALYETMIVLPDGQPGILSVSNDITEKRRVQLELISAKEKAEESDKLKSTFLASISHELRTPLNAIIGFSNLIAEYSKDEDTVTNSKIILNSGQHLLSLVEDVFDTTMIETGQIKIINEIIDIIPVLKEVRNIIYGESLRENKTGIEIILNIDQAINKKFLLTDSRRLKQALINLLRNAVKFTQEGYIEFGYTEIDKDDKKYLQFYVKDTGIGIDIKYHDVIFNIFRQIDNSNTRKYGGTGIGLSIAKKIVNMLGGEIWVESDPGKGSVTIPSLTEEEQKEFVTLNLETENNFTGKTILIAEDDALSFEFLRLVFKNMNIRVLWAKNGNEVINHCENDPSINLVLMDLKMPQLNGFEATRRLKKIRPELPVIAQTAYATMADKEEALKSGCNEYLSKPLQILQLKNLINKYLSPN
jgi:PAS domain S-box-containing protein